MLLYDLLVAVVVVKNCTPVETLEETILVVSHDVQVAESISAFASLKNLIASEISDADAITVPTPLYEPEITFELGEDPRQPATTMTPYAAKQYTKWLSLSLGYDFRLPSESEWEYASRAGTTTPYFFGNDAEILGDYAWYYEAKHPDRPPLTEAQKAKVPPLEQACSR